MAYVKNLSCLLFLLAICSTLACSKSASTKTSSSAEPAPEVAAELTLNLDNVIGTIDDLCYGVNEPVIPQASFRRLGGNRTTGYNWEINSSNAGNDNQHVSDRWLNTLVEMDEHDSAPAAWILKNVEIHRAESADTLVTIPTAGYVVADGSGESVSKRDAAPSKRWVKFEPTKPGGEFGAPDLDDGKAYADEMVAWLVSKLGSASEGGIKYYSLDNEPSIWSDTHARLHPKKTGYKEVADRAVATAQAVLAVDPDAEIVGPALYGWNGHATLQNAPNKDRFNQTHGSFSGYFLARMREASEKSGKRLLHIFDCHWYPEATGGGQRVTYGESGKDVGPAVVEARLQAPRSLWDPTYLEKSWITDKNGSQPIELIPRMQRIIEKHYPGTRFAILEYNYGAVHHYSGGLATADVLGIFGKYGVAGCSWRVGEDRSYEKAAFQLYLDYDGEGSRFEDYAIGVPAVVAQNESIYAARSEDKTKVTVVLINKQARSVLDKQIRFKGIQDVPAIRAFRFGPGYSELRQVSEDLEPSDGGFDIKCPPHTATIVELKL